MDFQKLYLFSKSFPLLQFFRQIHCLIIFVLVLVTGIVVYATGGIKYVYSHSMYFPIIYGALIYGALIYGLSGGVLVGLTGGWFWVRSCPSTSPRARRRI